MSKQTMGELLALHYEETRNFPVPTPPPVDWDFWDEFAKNVETLVRQRREWKEQHQEEEA